MHLTSTHTSATHHTQDILQFAKSGYRAKTGVGRTPVAAFILFTIGPVTELAGNSFGLFGFGNFGFKL